MFKIFVIFLVFVEIWVGEGYMGTRYGKREAKLDKDSIGVYGSEQITPKFENQLWKPRVFGFGYSAPRGIVSRSSAGVKSRFYAGTRYAGKKKRGEQVFYLENQSHEGMIPMDCYYIPFTGLKCQRYPHINDDRFQKPFGNENPQIEESSQSPDKF